MTREEKIICKHFLNDADKTHSCNEYKLLMALLEQEPTTKNDLEVDCISRAEAIKCLECDFNITGKENMKTVVNYINSAHDKIMNLPRVKQESKTGHWIWCMGSHKCSNCEEYTCFSDKELLRYCPNCGAKMVEP